MFNSPNPGLALRDDVLSALAPTLTHAAQQLDVSRMALPRVLNGRAAISPEKALRIEARPGAAVSSVCGEPSKAPMTHGGPDSALRPHRCTFNSHHRPPDGFRLGIAAVLRHSDRSEFSELSAGWAGRALPVPFDDVPITQPCPERLARYWLGSRDVDVCLGGALKEWPTRTGGSSAPLTRFHGGDAAWLW